MELKFNFNKLKTLECEKKKSENFKCHLYAANRQKKYKFQG